MKKILLLISFFGILASCLCACDVQTSVHAMLTHPLPVYYHMAPPMLGLMVSAVDSTRARAAYERIQYVVGCLINLQGQTNSSGSPMYPGIGQSVTSIIINQDDIVTEQQIQNNVSTYTFDLWDKTLQAIKNPSRPLVKGVKDNDLFMGIGCRLLIDSRVDNVGTPPVSQSNVKVETWPNPVTFAPSGATTNDLWSIYNSRMFLQVDRVVYIPGLFTRKFLKVPEFNLVNSSGTTQIPTDVIDGAKQYLEMDPYPIISGRLDNKLTLNVQLYPGWNGAANTSEYSTINNIITFEFTGFTIKNAWSYIPFFNGTLDVDNVMDVKNFNASGQ